jgi:hypothetical protein
VKQIVGQQGIAKISLSPHSCSCNLKVRAQFDHRPSALSIPKVSTLLDLIGARRLWYIDKHGWIALLFQYQALSLLRTSSALLPCNWDSPARIHTSFSSPSNSASSSSRDALRMRIFSGDAGVLSSSTGSGLMLGADRGSSGFMVLMGEMIS